MQIVISMHLDRLCGVNLLRHRLGKLTSLEIEWLRRLEAAEHVQGRRAAQHRVEQVGDGVYKGLVRPECLGREAAHCREDLSRDRAHRGRRGRGAPTQVVMGMATQRGDGTATLWLQCGYIVVTLWLHCGYTVVAHPSSANRPRGRR